MKLKEKRDETSKTETQLQAEAASESRTPSHEEIRCRAYEIYLERNGRLGENSVIGRGRKANFRRSFRLPKSGIAIEKKLRRFRTSKATLEAMSQPGVVHDDAGVFRELDRSRPHRRRSHLYTPDA